MNGVHDLGGMQGFGPVVIEPNEPVFHAAWEARVHALQTASGHLGKWNIDMSRHSRERMPPAAYLAATYYERWLYGLRTLLVEQGLVTPSELATGRAESTTDGSAALRTSDVLSGFRTGRTGRRHLEVEARFSVGDEVVARNINPPGHTRLPRYARAKQGAIIRDHGVFVFPDAHAATRDEAPQHCYGVRFAARELWGPDARADDSVYLDLWEEYLIAA